MGKNKKKKADDRQVLSHLFFHTPITGKTATVFSCDLGIMPIIPGGVWQKTAINS
jgi:hypothetical protein